MRPADAEVQERVDRLFERFERMTDAELMVLRTIWEEQDATARQDAWTMVKVAIQESGRERLLSDSRNRIAAWVNNYPAVMAMGDVPVSTNGSGMDPGSIRRAAFPPMLDAIAATIASDALTADDQTALLEPLTSLAR